MNYLVCAAFLAAGITSCTREIIDGDLGKNQVKEGTPTYATFKFVINGAGTKATAMIDDKNETENIKDIRLLIFRTGATTTCEVNEVYDDSSSDWEKNKSKTVQLTSGAKRIFVIANAEKQTGIKAALDGIKAGATTLDQFYDIAYDLGGGKVGNIDKLGELVDKTNGYVMSNAMGSNSAFILHGGIGIDESRKGTDKENNFNIEIQRAVAKTAVFYESESVLETTDKVGKLNEPHFMIRNLNRSLYLFQKFASDAVDPKLATSIPRSPNYSWPTGSTPTTYDSLYFKNHSFVKIEKASDPSTRVYATENTSELPRNATTTYAAIVAEFLPKKGMIIESYKYNDLTNAFSAVTTNANNAKTATTLYRLVNVGTSTGITANIFFTNKNLAYKAAYFIENKSDKNFDLANAVKDLAWDGTKGYIVEYEGGKSYYRLNLGEGSGTDFVAGMKRNYMYKAKITSFASIGMPKLEDLDKDPDKPIGQKTHVTASISVAKWNVVTTEHPL
ncbi:MAG: Mfa1 family fimbria major subunit [Tannerellaceae bacterium]|nr:Mfa1 family fimbria major subunit [Tannerellaceae bacterium]